MKKKQRIQIYPLIEHALRYMAQHENCLKCENGGMTLVCLTHVHTRETVRKLLRLPPGVAAYFEELYDSYFWWLFHFTIQKYGKKETDPDIWGLKPNWSFSDYKGYPGFGGLNINKVTDWGFDPEERDS